MNMITKEIILLAFCLAETTEALMLSSDTLASSLGSGVFPVVGQ